MANTKISALTSSTTPLAGTEVLPIVQSSATVKVAVSDLTAGRTVSATKFTPTGSSAAGNGLYLPAANALGLSTNGANAVYIDSSQNVGVGITPGAKLDVSGVIRSTGTGAILTFSKRSTGTGDAWGMYSQSGEYNIYDYTAGVSRLVIDASGIVTMSAYGAGAATFSAAGVISSVSDETWKIKDGAPVDPDAMLKKLEPGYWYYNDEKKETFGFDRQLGFYAQNVNAAIGPEAAPTPETVISKAEDGTDIVTTKPWGYYDRSVLAVTVMSLQKAIATIESLTARIKALEAKIPA